MVDVSTKVIGADGAFGMVRMGDPQKVDGQDQRLVALEYPYPGSGTYASWPVGASGWEAKTAIDDSCLFQVSSTGTALHAERAGPLDWLLIPGLF